MEGKASMLVTNTHNAQVVTENSFCCLIIPFISHFMCIQVIKVSLRTSPHLIFQLVFFEVESMRHQNTINCQQLN